MKSCLWALLIVMLAAACSRIDRPAPASAALSTTRPGPVVRRGFLGAFYRPQGAVPFGVFSIYSKNKTPEPYPEPRSTLFGPSGYCDAVAENGVSISTGYVVDHAKLANLIDLGVKWTRTPIAPFSADLSHVFGAGRYEFGQFDAAQCALTRHSIRPIIGLEAGPVQYNPEGGGFAPKSVPLYRSAADFGAWCGTVARHERAVFPAVSRYSIPGNEVNGNRELFPGGEPQVASYTAACYRAIKAVQPHAVVYGFELNMDRNADPAGFVGRMAQLDCKPHTCYDAIALHLSLRYPIPPTTRPCFPSAGGDYALRCIADVQKAAGAPVHVLISETGYFVPSSVPDEAAKANAIADAMEAYARDPLIDGVNYGNVDECDAYPSGYFVGGCLVDSLGKKLPGYFSLQRLARGAF